MNDGISGRLRNEDVTAVAGRKLISAIERHTTCRRWLIESTVVSQHTWHIGAVHPCVHTDRIKLIIFTYGDIQPSRTLITGFDNRLCVVDVTE